MSTPAVEILLTKGYVAHVDPQDFRLVRYKWRARVADNGRVYAQRHRGPGDAESPSEILMHRQILGVTDPQVDVDHADGDGLNNRRFNLREKTRAENSRNVVGARVDNLSSGLLGVSFNKRLRKWHAYINFDGKRRHIGFYGTKAEASSARLAVEKELWGVQPRRAAAHG